VTLICPVCRQALALNGRTYGCPAGHAFDRAREGYVNLLLRRPGSSVGDSREMLAARRAFLGGGHYRPLSDAINERVQSQLAHRTAATVLDVGCGEGYYLCRLRATLGPARSQSGAILIGVDVAREAVRLAARACPEATFAVADVWSLVPVADGSVDVLLSVFSPRNRAEFERVLAPDGLLLVVVPEPEHLQELRSLPGFLGVPEDKRDALVQQLTGGFRLVDERVISLRLGLVGDDLVHLAAMTPSARHLSPATLEGLRALAMTPVTAAFRLLGFAKVGPRR